MACAHERIAIDREQWIVMLDAENQACTAYKTRCLEPGCGLERWIPVSHAASDVCYDPEEEGGFTAKARDAYADREG